MITLGLLRVYFFFQAEDGIRDYKVTGVQTCALPIWRSGCALKGPIDRRFPAWRRSGSSYRSAARERPGCATARIDGTRHRGRRREWTRSEEHTSELQSPCNLVCRLLLEKKKTITMNRQQHLLQSAYCSQSHRFN